ncbi:Snf7 family [Crepidotus variabilis]|uniref:Snf7 family n=1 Tax=Crepidotus variabilis TaxID=179855 RepID=A0A9P6E749_9AGAR|nr:Snf7 family [Crepidotus variabilis]
MGGNQSLPKITAQDKAILDLKLQRDQLRQYQKKIQAIQDREQAIAKVHLEAGNKERALVALRRRKYQQSLLVKTDGQLENLEQLVSTIEFSLVELSVLHGLKQGNDVLKEIHKEMNIESVEKLLEETAEAREYQREIGDMLANNLSLDDEDAVQKELEEMQAEALGDKAGEELQLPSVPLPSVPKEDPVKSPETDPVKSKERVAVAA